MFQKITYEFVWDGTRQNQRKEGEVMVRAMQGKRKLELIKEDFKNEISI